MTGRQRKCGAPTLLGVFAKGQSGRLAARIFLRFKGISDARAIARQVPAIARKVRTTEDDVWCCLYYQLLGFREKARA